ncbi:unnamed protein product [Caenorhabditis auriculariae]|uniref:Galectin n=1 Tax=Caenorhabditis auriculariae TaxID=2777116 RepID=A0A8S1H488_9PELO|nr:unnamed protein product [Caenorhabditis auriculariae]
MKFLLAFIGLLPLASAIGFRSRAYNIAVEGLQIFGFTQPLEVGDIIIVNGIGRSNLTQKYLNFLLLEGVPLSKSLYTASLSISSDLDTGIISLMTYTDSQAFDEELRKGPIKRNGDFKLKILVRPIDYQIFFDDKLFYTYNYRRPSSLVRSIGFEGMKFSKTDVYSQNFGEELAGTPKIITVQNGMVSVFYGSVKIRTFAPYTPVVRAPPSGPEPPPLI